MCLLAQVVRGLKSQDRGSLCSLGSRPTPLLRNDVLPRPGILLPTNVVLEDELVKPSEYSFSVLSLGSLTNSSLSVLFPCCMSSLCPSSLVGVLLWVLSGSLSRSPSSVISELCQFSLSVPCGFRVFCSEVIVVRS